MISTQLYSQFASITYKKTEENKLPLPTGWTVRLQEQNSSSGFSATAFKNGNDIVIAYTGTNGEIWGAFDFSTGNIPAATGLPSGQVQSAMEFYLATRNVYPDANITFTGHSLGGGLASLMGVYFDKKAVTFDPAPFALSAVQQATLLFYNATLAAQGASDPAFDQYIQNPDLYLLQRVHNVSAHAIEGEVLHEYLGGRTLTIVNAAEDYFYQTYGNTGTVNLHSVLLLSAILGSGKFADLLKYDPDILPLIFDDKLYATQGEFSSKTDFMHAIMQRHWSGENILDKFSDDVQLSRGDTGIAQTQLHRELTLLAMESYYSGNSNSPFVKGNGSLSFRFSDIGNLEFLSKELFINAALAFVSTEEKQYLTELNKDGWLIQSGATPLGTSSATIDLSHDDLVLGGGGNDTASGGAMDDIMIGGVGNDSLSGDDGVDVLLGGLDNDTLNGGDGNDTLIGGAGGDSLLGGSLNDFLDGGTGNDTIYGGDGYDRITGGDDNDEVHGGGDVDLISGGKGDDLLEGEGGDDLLQGFAGNDTLYGGDDDDVLEGGDQDDSLIGGDGDDKLDGGLDSDNLSGGKGLDVLVGDVGNDTLDGVDGSGGDLLIGGVGYDVYYADDGDRIFDADGQGEVWLNGKRLAIAEREKGQTAYRDSNGNVFFVQGESLLVNDPLAILGFSDGMLGIDLIEKDKDDPLDPPGKKNFDDARRTVSPIVLDLNGGGIQTTGIAEGAFFDYDNNGFAERTAWVAPGEGVLVRDLNRNGKIDNGGELFGDRTLQPDGTRYSNGFAALSALDDNRDGLLDSRDIAWNELSVWRDANSNGIVDASELQTLNDAHVSSVGTSSVSSTSVDAHGNEHRLVGKATLADGSVIAAEDIWFKVNTASTKQVNQLPLSQDVVMLPGLGGMGNVPSLHQAIQADGSGRLRQLLEDYSVEQSMSQRAKIVQDLLFAWAGVTDVHPGSRGQYGDARVLSALEKFFGQDYVQYAGTNAGTPNPGPGAFQFLNSSFSELSQAINTQLMAQTWLKQPVSNVAVTWSTEGAKLQANIAPAMDYFASKYSSNPESTIELLSSFANVVKWQFGEGAFDSAVAIAAIATVHPDVALYAHAIWEASIGTDGNDTLRAPLNGGVVAGLGGSDRIFGSTGNDQLIGGNGNDSLDDGGGNDTLDGGAGDDYIRIGGGDDALNFSVGFGQDAVSLGWAEGSVLVQFGQGLIYDSVKFNRNVSDLILEFPGGTDRLVLLGYFPLDGSIRPSVVTIKFSDGMSLTQNDIEQILIPQGSSHNDSLYGFAGSDAIGGLQGDDVLYGEGGNDTLGGGEGADTLYGGSGDDVLAGGVGNDFLVGGPGNNTVRFEIGDGRDVASGPLREVILGGGVLPSGVKVQRDQYSIRFELLATGETLTVDDHNLAQLKVKFDNGTVWSTSDLRDLIAQATDLDDVVSGAEYADQLNGMAGNDKIFGREGNDTIRGGVGNDTIDGGTGADVFLFGRGDGKDMITGSNYYVSPTDILRIDASLNFADILVRKDAEYFYLNFSGTNDEIVIDRRTVGITQIEDASGNVLSWSDLMQRGHSGTNASEVMYGEETADLITGRAGNDTLMGGEGADVYLYDRGDGSDVIIDYSMQGNVIRFGSGIEASDIQVTRDEHKIYLRVGDTSDAITVENWSEYYQSVSRVEFANGKSWAIDDLFRLSLHPSASGEHLIGGPTPDSISGLGGNDTLSGGSGDDTLVGGTGDDLLTGGQGSDVYRYGLNDGSDTIRADYFDQDTLILDQSISESDVSVSRDAGAFYLSIANTTDRIRVEGSEPRIVVEFSNGVRWNAAELQSRSLNGTSGSNFLFGVSGGETLWGGGGDDTLQGNGGGDTLIGGTGEDILDGGFGSDLYRYDIGDGFDSIVSGKDDSIDVVRFGSGIAASNISAQVSRAGVTLYFGAASQDRLLIAGDIAPESLTQLKFEFSDGTSMLLRELKELAHHGTTGSELIEGTIYNDTISGSVGADTLKGDYGNDQYFYRRGDGSDTIEDVSGTLDILQFDSSIAVSDVTVRRDGGARYFLSIAGSDDRITISSFGGGVPAIEEIQFADGTRWDSQKLAALSMMGSSENDTLYSMRPGDSLSGLNGADILYGQTGNESLQGGSADDTLYGFDGDDTLNGGTGNDLLLGNHGNDVYIFALGDGSDTVYVGNGTNVLRFTESVLPSDVVVQRMSSVLYLLIKNTADKISLVDLLNNSSSFFSVEFANGDVWTLENLLQRSMIPTERSDLIIGSNNNETIEGLEGADTLQGGGGNDLISGGAGDDRLDGGSGNDIYVYMKGDGKDVIVSDEAGNGEINILRFGASISKDVIQVDRAGKDLYLIIDGTQGSIVLQGAADPNLRSVQQIEFADGTVWDTNTLLIRTTLVTEDNDSISGGDDNELLDGRGGNDTLIGGGGEDSLIGGSGNDLLDGGYDKDTYLFSGEFGQDVIVDSFDSTIQFDSSISASEIVVRSENGNLLLTVPGIDSKLTLRYWSYMESPTTTVRFADGTQWSAADLKQKAMQGSSFNDVIFGTPGSDVLRGLGGDDTLMGGSGDDTYIVEAGDGLELILDAVGSDVLRFGSSISSMDVSIRRFGMDLELTAGAANTTVKLAGVFQGSYVEGVKRIEFADGTRWDAIEMINRIKSASDGDDTLYGGNADDTIAGMGGNDCILAGYGNDLLRGNSGNDTLEGGVGSDTYEFARGDGADSIEDISYEGDVNIIKFHSAIAPSDIKVHRDAFDLYLSIIGTEDRISLRHWSFGEMLQKGMYVKFSDGTTWDAARLMELSSAVAGTDENDIINGTANDDIINGLAGDDHIEALGGNDVIDGGSGNDYIRGDDGNDVIRGGAGDDYYLSGGNGNDVYIYELGDGVDEITEEGNGTDILRFGTGIDPREIQAVRIGSSIELSLNGSKLISLFGWFVWETQRVDRFEFADGTVWLADELTARVSGPTAGDDYLEGTLDADQIDGLGGDDYIYGDEGDDTLFGGDGDDDIDGDYDNDLIYGGNGNDTLYGYHHNDTLLGDAGSDEIYGQDGNDEIHGGDDDDYLDGGDGFDTIYGDNGADTMIGGLNTDKLVGGLGNDVYELNGTSGADQIVEVAGEGTDQVNASVTFTLPNYVEILRLQSNAAIDGVGNSSDNLVFGNIGDNKLSGGLGSDILLGNGGNDLILDASGHTVALGGDGNDDFVIGSSNAFIAGGAGNDKFTLSGEHNVIAFNRADGNDTVVTRGTGFTISLGGGIAYADLVLTKTGEDLVLLLGATDQITLTGWYGTEGATLDCRLQFVIQDGPDYIPGSQDAMASSAVQLFDLDALVAKFDLARVANTSISTWDASAELLSCRIKGGNDGAIGAEFALQYSSHRNLSEMSLGPAQSILEESGFGEVWQAFLVGTPLSDDTPLLT